MDGSRNDGSGPPAVRQPLVQPEVTRTTLAVLGIGGLIAVTLWIMRPFLGSLIWATMIVVVTWPLLLRLQGWLAGKRWLAVAAMTLAILIVFVLPFWFAVDAIIDHSKEAVHWASNLHDVKIPQPPDLLHRVPLVGKEISGAWREIASLTPEALNTKVQPYVAKGMRWVLAGAGTIGMLIIQILLTLVIVVVLYANGDAAAQGVRRFGRRLAGAHGEEVVQLAGQAIRAVALGVVVTALAQGLLGAIGLAVAGVPFAGTLTAVMLILCLAQLGPTCVLIPATMWVYWSGDNFWGTALLIWTVFVSTVDNFLRPVLIKKGADLPLLLIFAGVIGGLLSFGAIGIFVGPVVLAVTYRLVQAWVNEADAPAARESSVVAHPGSPP
jgi:predicted PurR-regulated permease PerM